MSPIYVSDGKILISGDGKLASLPCPTGCCGREPPGVCCSGVWYDTPPEQGVCCSGTNALSGIWVPSNLPAESGVCCDNEWYPPEVDGDCCVGVWYHGDPPECPEGEIYLRWGANEECCGCLPTQILDPITNEMVNTNDVKNQLCCPVCSGGVLLPGPSGCLGRCCSDCNCTSGYYNDCPGQWLSNCCETRGCPQPCCGEDEDCNVTCEENIDSQLCINSSRVPGECDTPCADACLGACCEDGIVTGITTQANCDGCWSGPGSTTCTGSCVDSVECCESKTSKDAGLTFSKPPSKANRCKDCSVLEAETLRVTVTGTTDSPILIHGTPFGSDSARCPIDHSFLICWENFNIEPVPCGSNFRYLDVEVCWETEATDTELLNYSGCDGITVWLGGCSYGCVTTLVYSGAGHTSDVEIVLYGDAVIDSSGSGALVLIDGEVGKITTPGSCVETLTLTGTNTDNNEIAVAIPDSSNGLDVIKTGVGTWVLSVNSTYTGQLKVLNGTLVVATAVNSSGPSPFGAQSSPIPLIGSTAADATGTVALLVQGGVVSNSGGSIDRSLSVAPLTSGSQVVVLGVRGEGLATFGGNILLGRSVTLQASNSGTANFTNLWQTFNGGPNPAVAYTIGSAGNAGVVQFENTFSGSATGVSIVNGTAILALNNNTIDPATPVIVGSNLGPATLDINNLYDPTISQQLGNLTFAGNSGSITSSGNNGTLRLWSGSTASVTVNGTGHVISSAVALDVASTFNIGSASKLTVTGPISDGANGAVVFTKSGLGILELTAANTYTGDTTITGGSLIANQIVTNPGNRVTSATFTPSSLTVAFSSDPTSGQQYKLLTGATVQAYATVTLTGTAATGTYDSATSTLTID